MRNRYLDILRAAAMVQVVVHHHFGWPWLSIVFPAMGVLFAVAGSLTAASLRERTAGSVVAARLRRLLPPLWLLGLIVVPAMLATGWAREEGGQHPYRPAGLVFWMVPLGDPPGSAAGVGAWEPLWYIRAYLWFVLLSPLLHAGYRKLAGARLGWLMVAAPILGIAVLNRAGFELPATAGTALWDFVTYGACWIAGFAHHDGRLARLRPATVLAAGVVLGGAALYWQNGHPGQGYPWDLNDVPASQALWSLAFVLLLLRWQPDTSRVARFRVLDRAVNLLNARALTVYLWQNLARTATSPALTHVAVDGGGGLAPPVTLATTILLTAVAVLAFGWVEDLAAGRRPRLWPSGADERRSGPAPAPAVRTGPPPVAPRMATAGPSPLPVRTPGAARSPLPVRTPGSGPARVRATDLLPVGWPEVPGTPQIEPSTQRILPQRMPPDMPVAGRPPAGERDGGVPWAGHRAPRQGIPEAEHPLPLRFTRSDGAP